MSGSTPLGRAVLARAQAVAGQTGEAEGALRELINLSESGETYVPAYGIALIHLGLDDKTSALDGSTELTTNDSSGWYISTSIRFGMDCGRSLASNNCNNAWRFPTFATPLRERRGGRGREVGTPP